MTKIETEQNQSDSALPAVRRAEILRLVKQLGQITVTEMSARFEVSLDTIRRDLDTLADQGLISRIHGGAVPMDSMAAADSPFEHRINAHQIAKTNIGRLGFAVVAPLDQLDVVVTDEEPPRELKVALEAAGVRIVVAS